MSPLVDLKGICVSVPADTSVVHVLRGVVSSVAARLNFGYEQIDDLRLAVDEACAHLLSARPAATRVTLQIAPTGDGIQVTAIRDNGPDAWPPTGARQTLAWKVLNALADEAVFEQTGDGSAIRFIKRWARET